MFICYLFLFVSLVVKEIVERLLFIYQVIKVLYSQYSAATHCN